MDALEVVASTCDPAFAVDLEGTILAWNQAAEETFGFRRGAVVGHRCWKVVEGRDVFGNRYCGEHCPLRDNALRGEPLHSGEMSLATAAGETLQVNNRCMLVTGASCQMLTF